MVDVCPWTGDAANGLPAAAAGGAGVLNLFEATDWGVGDEPADAPSGFLHRGQACGGLDD